VFAQPANATIRLGCHVGKQYVESLTGELDNVFIFSAVLDAAQLETIRAHGARGVAAVAAGREVEEKK
jgi:hypothetical protein